MASAQDTTNMARAFAAAEMVMAVANCGGPVAARVRAKQLLDDYFVLIERALPWTEHNSLDRRS